MSQGTTPPSPPAQPPRGITCPRCGCGHFHVLRIERRARHVQRRRECRNCGHRITTRETILGVN